MGFAESSFFYFPAAVQNGGRGKEGARDEGAGGPGLMSEGHAVSAWGLFFLVLIGTVARRGP